MSHQVKVQQLKDLITNLPAKDQSFANSLCSQAHLSEKQLYWVDVLLERAMPTDAAHVATAPECQGLLDFISRNNNAKYPKVGFIVQGLNLAISKASDRARFPGSLNVVVLQEPKQNFGEWVGRVRLDGSFEAHRSIGDERRNQLIGVLNEIAQDPVELAKEYARKTGCCSFCNLPLNDPKSLLAGYGPICAKNYDLPWGGK